MGTRLEARLNTQVLWSAGGLLAWPDPRSSIERFVDSLYSLLVWPRREPPIGEKSASMAHAMSDERFSKNELKVRAIAKRRANAQLLRVPWSRFRKAYEQYPRWQALALWVQAVIAARDNVPAWLTEDLRKLCPGFVEHEGTSHEPKVMGLHLLEWAHTHEFGVAKRQGWLGALTFYGVRHPCSECAWTYWEYCENHWSKDQPEVLPTFDKWWRQAQTMMPCNESDYRELKQSIEQYLDWEALILWLRPLLASDVNLPRRFILELERRCPGILTAEGCRTQSPDVENSKIRRGLVKWGRNQSRWQAGEQDQLDLRQQAEAHPLHARFLFYAKHWASQQTRSSARSYPSFREWRLAAHRYVVESSRH